MHKFRFAIFFMMILDCERAFATDCSSGWESYSSEPYQELAMPDTNVKYWRYRFEVDGKKLLYLKVSGEFPTARYMNFTSYDQRTQNGHATLSDFMINPDDGSINPYANPYANPDRETQGEKKYRFALLQKGKPVPPWANGNTLQAPTPRDPEDTKAVEIWYRIYLPDLAQDATNAIPPVGLPTIEAVDEAGADMPCPTPVKITPRLWVAFRNIPPADHDGKIIFRAPSSESVYANPDTKYLAAALNLSHGQAAAIRFRAPRTPASGRKRHELFPRTDVRYWSMCIVGLDTRTSGCISDTNVKIDGDGFVNIVIGPESLRQDVELNGMNFLEKGRFSRPLIIYRNLLPRKDFPGNFNLIPTTSNNETTLQGGAETYIGEYAPLGKTCDLSDLLKAHCGILGEIQ